MWSNFGPYHRARLAAAAGAVNWARVQGVEIGSLTSIYGWQVQRQNLGGLATLFPGEVAERIPAWRIALSLVRFVNSNDAVCWFIPSYLPLSSTIALVVCSIFGIPVIMMNESHGGSSTSGVLGNLLKRFIVPLFSGALVGGKPHAHHFQGLGMSRKRMRLGYDAVDNAYFGRRALQIRTQASIVRRKWGLPDQYILSLGRFEAKKNLSLLLSAYADIANKATAALVFVGSGSLKRELIVQCAKAGLTVHMADESYPVGKANGVATARVFFYDFKQVEDLPDFYALSSVFVLASLREEWGLVVNEAMACGVPVLVSRSAGCAADLVIDGVTGFCFAPDDRASLAGHMQRILRDSLKASQMGEAAQRHIRNWGCERFGCEVDALSRMVALERGAVSRVL